MLTLSTTMQAAMEAGAPQRILLEFTDTTTDPATVTILSNEDIAVTSGVRLTSAFNGEEELTFGLCPSAQISFTLLNDTQTFTEFQFGECAAWIGYRIDSGTPVGEKTRTFVEGGVERTYEFAPLGVFIVERPDVVVKDTIQITASDRMKLFDIEMPSQSSLGVTLPTTIKGLLQAMCSYVGVTLATTTFLNDNLSFSSWPTKYFNGRTMREVLKWIAEAAGSIARFNRAGQLEIAWFSLVNMVYDESDYKEFTQSWYETAPIDGLKVRNLEETSESSYGDNENPYVISGNPFLR